MTPSNHPDLDVLLHLASGRAEQAASQHLASQHLETCAPCQRRLVELRGVLSSAREELLEQRPFCPSSDELAEWSLENPHPHLETCPLCNEEVLMRDLLDAEDRAEEPVDSFASAPWMAPLESVTASAAYLDAGVGERLALEPGKKLHSNVAGARVSLECTGDKIRAKLEGGTAVLVLGDQHLEKRLPLPPGEHLLEVGSWLWVRIEAED